MPSTLIEALHNVTEQEKAMGEQIVPKPPRPLEKREPVYEASPSRHSLFAPDRTDALLKERGSVHGGWEKQADLAKQLKLLISSQRALPAFQSEALEMIAVKISRILAGDPNHRDHWDDIAGYARLVSQQLEKGNG